MKKTDIMIVDLKHKLRDFILDDPSRKARLETKISAEIVLKEGRIRDNSKSIEIEEKILAHSIR